MSQNTQTLIKETKLPPEFVWAVVGICLLPFFLNIFGVDFGSSKEAINFSAVAQMRPLQAVEVIHQSLSGSFTHTILEWSAFCTAIFTAILSFVHFQNKRDVVTPIIGIALFFAGSMDAFHTLAADRLIQGVADNNDLVPFTWAICRLFNALIMICGAGLFLVTGSKQWRGNLSFIAIISASFGFVAYGIIHFCATSAHLPQTTFPNSPITRPWDLLPLLLYIFAGVFVFPNFYRKYPSLFSHSLIVSVIPSITVQMHMAFGSAALFDNHFHIGHFLKIVAYLVPFTGLSLEYIRTYRKEGLVLKTVTNSSELISATLEQQERMAIQQATAVNQTTTTMDELAASSQHSAQQAQVAATSAEQVLTLAEGGKKTVAHTLEDMATLKKKVEAIAFEITRLSEQTSEIGNISSLVTDLANQTNMLALNAAVEAARAGEQGKGFGVVAKEIRHLADRSRQSAEKINTLVADIQSAIKITVNVTGEGKTTVDQGVKTAQGTAETFISVANAINSIVASSQQISHNNKQQAIAIQQIFDAMNTLNQGAAQTASGISETKFGLQQVNEALLRLADI